MPYIRAFRHSRTLYEDEERCTLHVCTAGGEEGLILHVHIAYSEEGYTLQVHTADGVGYTLHVQTAGGGEGYSCTSIVLAMKRDTLCTSTVLAVEEGHTLHTHISTACGGNRYTLTSTLLVVETKTSPRPSIVDRDTPSCPNF
jgi:hypothetical protein